ncbi:hypothetical protein OQA88_9453 [Cercophora sp. LCS_1]
MARSQDGYAAKGQRVYSFVLKGTTYFLYQNDPSYQQSSGTNLYDQATQAVHEPRFAPSKVTQAGVPRGEPSRVNEHHVNCLNPRATAFQPRGNVTRRGYLENTNFISSLHHDRQDRNDGSQECHGNYARRSIQEHDKAIGNGHTAQLTHRNQGKKRAGVILEETTRHKRVRMPNFHEENVTLEAGGDRRTAEILNRILSRMGLL